MAQDMIHMNMAAVEALGTEEAVALAEAVLVKGKMTGSKSDEHSGIGEAVKLIRDQCLTGASLLEVTLEELEQAGMKLGPRKLLVQHMAKLHPQAAAASLQVPFPRVVRTHTVAESVSRITMQTVGNYIPQKDELSLLMRSYTLNCIGSMDPKGLVLMHLIPHAAVKSDGQEQEVLRQVMRSKIGYGTWEEKCDALLVELRKIPSLQTSLGTIRCGNDRVQGVAEFVLGRASRELTAAEKEVKKKEEELQKLTGSARLQSEQELPMLVGQVKLKKMGIELIEEQWPRKTELTEDDMFEAFLSVVDSEANVVRTHKFFEVLFDCWLWVPVYDEQEKCYKLLIPNWPYDEFKNILQNNADRYMKFGGVHDPEKVVRVLKEWHAMLKGNELQKVTFPPRVFNTILAYWSASVLRKAGYESDVIKLEDGCRSPVLLCPRNAKPATAARAQTATGVQTLTPPRQAFYNFTVQPKPQQ